MIRIIERLFDYLDNRVDSVRRFQGRITQLVALIVFIQDETERIIRNRRYLGD
jgi:hypothetical protein